MEVSALFGLDPAHEMDFLGVWFLWVLVTSTLACVVVLY